jgi:hypothetical protein
MVHMSRCISESLERRIASFQVAGDQAMVALTVPPEYVSDFSLLIKVTR